MKFIDLFAGIGGFHYAIKNWGKKTGCKVTPVMVSEINEFAKKTYAINHKFDINKIHDIKKYTSDTPEARQLLDEIEDFDLLMGGFPCQSFSHAGNKLGFLDDTRGTLFFDIIKIIKIKQPKYILLENVKHLVSHDYGNTWHLIKKSLRQLGYWVPEKPLLLSPHEYAVPQIRWRVFIPAIRKDKCKISQENIEFSLNEKMHPKKFIFDKKIDDYTILQDKKILNALNAWGEFIKNVKRPFYKTLPVIWLDYMNEDKISNLELLPKWKQKYINDMRLVYKNNKKYIDEWMVKYNTNKWQKRERKLEWQAGKEEYSHKNAYVQLRQSGLRFKKPNVFPTLVAMVQTSLIFDKKIQKWRYLSRNEVRKLQSFPKNFIYNVPIYQTYKQFGNAVNVKVTEMVLHKLLAL